MGVSPIPEGRHTVTPYLLVPDAARLIEFLKQAFGATEAGRFANPDGRIMHAAVRIGDSVVLMGEPASPWKPMPAMMCLYVPDVDAAYRRALAAGARSLQEPADKFYGDRNAGVEDPCGNLWWIATHQEDVPPEELERRARAFSGPSPAG